MALSSEEILLTIGARDNASSIAGNVDKSFQGMANNISQALSSLNSSMMNFGQVSDNIMQGLTGKSAMDNILGTTTKAETNSVLIEMMTESEKAAESLNKTVDKVTDTSLTSMQDLIPAMNAFKSATGASDKELESITDEMANFGAAVLAQTGSTDLAQQSMMDLSKGIKGAFASLDQYGVSEDALMRTGLWSGKEDDVKGYMAAVQEVIGSTDKLMETNQGLDALIGKAFSRAGKKMGNEFLPALKDIKKGFLDLDNELGGNLTASILAVSGGFEVMNQGFWNISTTINGVRDLKAAWDTVSTALKGVASSAKTATGAMNMASNASDIGAGLGGAGSALGVGADVMSNTSKSEKTVDMGTDALSLADFIQNNKNESKILEKEAEELFKERGEIMEKIHNFAGSKNSKKFKKIQQQLSKNDLELQKSMEGFKPLEWLRSNKNNKKLSNEELGTLFGSLDDTLDVFDNEGMTLSKAIKGKIGGFKNTITGAFSSIKNFNLGETLQNGLLKGFGGLGNIAQTIKGKFSSFGKTLSSLKDIDIAGKIKGALGSLDKNLYQSIKGFSFKDTLGKLKGAFSGLDGAKEVTTGVEKVAEVGESIAAVGPAMETAAAGGEATAAGAAGLSATFTSMIVPLLALSAVIIIMIPIVAVIAAEAMIFIRLLADFMEALHFENINLDGAVNGIKSIAEALAWVGAAMAAMTFTSIMTGLAIVTGGFLGITGPLAIAKSALMDAATKLQEFSSIKIDPSIPGNLKSISDSLNSVSKAMLSLTTVTITTGFSAFIAWAFKFGSISSAMNQAKEEIIKASSALNNLGSGITPLDESKAQNIQNVCNSLASVGDAMSALKSIRDSQNWDDIFGSIMSGLFGEGLNIQEALNKVKTDIVNASIALSQFTNLQEIPEDVGNKIQKVSDALTKVADAFKVLRGFRDDNVWDEMIGGLFGGTDIGSALGKILSDIRTAATYLQSMNSIAVIDEEVGTKIQNVTNALQKVSEAATKMTSLPPMDGFNSENIHLAVQNVANAARELATLSSITLTEDNTGILGTINSALTTLKSTLANATGFSGSAVHIGSEIVNGVKSGLAPLPSTVISQVSTATNSAAGAGWTGGAHIGTSVTNGFKSSLQLATVMTTEMGHVKSAVDSGISAAKSAAESGARDIVRAFQNGVNVGSPGDIARTMKQEMIYTKDFILGAGPGLMSASYGVAKSIVKSFGNPMLTTGFRSSNLNSHNLATAITSVPNGGNSNKNINIYVSEGAVSIDARNKTVKEAKQMGIAILESFDGITDINVAGE